MQACCLYFARRGEPTVDTGSKEMEEEKKEVEKMKAWAGPCRGTSVSADDRNTRDKARAHSHTVLHCTALRIYIHTRFATSDRSSLLRLDCR